MKSIRITLGVMVVLGVCGALIAAEPTPRVEAVSATTETGWMPEREPSPMVKEMLAAEESARQEIAELKIRYEAVTDDQAAMEIMREVARIKKETRIEMMRIQLRYAIARGDDEAVAELEEIVLQMEALPPKGVPIHRSPDHK